MLSVGELQIFHSCFKERNKKHDLKETDAAVSVLQCQRQAGIWMRLKTIFCTKNCQMSAVEKAGEQRRFGLF